MFRTAAIVTLLGLGTVAQALPLANPADASILESGFLLCDNCFSMRLGFYGDYVFNRHMQLDRSDGSDSSVDDTEITTNAGYIVFNWADRIDAFAVLGATNITILANAEEFAVSGFPSARGPRIEIYTGADFCASGGARATLFTWGPVALGVEGQYFWSKPAIGRVVFQSTNTNYPNDLNLTYTEWQIGGGLTYFVNSFIFPYVGVMGSSARMTMEKALITHGSSILRLYDLENEFAVAYAIGITVAFYDEVSFTAEGRFTGEKGLYINGQVRF